MFTYVEVLAFKHYCMPPSVHDYSSIARPAMEVSVGMFAQLLICALVCLFILLF